MKYGVAIVLAVLLVLMSTGCATTGVPMEPKVITQKVPVRAACPAKAEYDRLKVGRPVPLRSQPMPADPDVRSAKQVAQLGRYEAEGGWADKVEAALDRCQLEDPIAKAP